MKLLLAESKLGYVDTLCQVFFESGQKAVDSKVEFTWVLDTPSDTLEGILHCNPSLYDSREELIEFILMAIDLVYMEVQAGEVSERIKNGAALN